MKPQILHDTAQLAHTCPRVTVVVEEVVRQVGGGVHLVPVQAAAGSSSQTKAQAGGGARGSSKQSWRKAAAGGTGSAAVGTSQAAREPPSAVIGIKGTDEVGHVTGFAVIFEPCCETMLCWDSSAFQLSTCPNIPKADCMSPMFCVTCACTALICTQVQILAAKQRLERSLMGRQLAGVTDPRMLAQLFTPEGKTLILQVCCHQE